MKNKQLTNTIFSRLQKKSKLADSLIEKDEIQTILHELDVYEAELLAQNEELIESHEKLIEANDENNLLFENSPTSHIVIDSNHIIKRINKRSRQTFHLASSSINTIKFDLLLERGQLLDFYEWLHSESSLEDSILLKLRTREKVSSLFKVQSDDFPGQKKWKILTLENIQKEHDLIEEIKNLNEKSKKEAELQNQLKMEAIGELLSNISHQWKQPLSVITSIISGMQIKKEMNENITEAEFSKSCKSVLNQSNYLASTINDFLSFFKSTAEVKKEFNIKNSIDTLSVILGNMFKDIATIQVNSQEAILINNENLLIQALINICNNTKDVLLEKIENPKKRLFFVDAIVNEENITISFKDSGNGIDNEVIDKIFEPYFTTKHESVGTGIGLYMTHQIITKHFNGKIEVKNVEYKYNDYKLKGAEFRVILPRLNSKV